jgi:GNAT superfamily N-acetyltransferase
VAVAKVHVRSWQVAYRGLLSGDYLDGLKPEDRAKRYSFGSSDPSQPATLVALMDGVICGFATTSPARDKDSAGKGELSGLYVDPDWWDSGVGRVLIAAARGRLAGQGFASALLWVLDSNARAMRFYTKDGWIPDGMRRVEKIWDVKVQEVRYSRPLP